MRYLAIGPKDGPKILLVHGLVIMCHYFEPLMLELAKKGYRVYAPELPGTGYSPRLPYVMTIEEMTEVFKWWLEHMGITEPLHVVGHSAGAQIAVELELRYPHLVDTLALLAAAGGNPVTGWFREIVGVLSDASVERPYLIWHAACSYFRAGLLESLGHARTHVKYNLTEKVKELGRKPTLVLWGTRDIISPIKFAHYLAETIQDARLKIIKRATHGLVIGYHKPVSNELHAFFQEVTAERSTIVKDAIVAINSNEVEVIFQRQSSKKVPRLVRTLGAASTLTLAKISARQLKKVESKNPYL